MFESLVASILNGILGKYIKDLDSSNLNLGILKGNVVLTDLELRDDALDGFHLPVEVTQGYVGKISLKIPWTDLYSQPFDIIVHDVYLMAGPIRDRQYDAERAEASEIAAKRKRLSQIEQRMEKTGSNASKEDTKDVSDGSDSFVDKLVAQVVKNLKISVKNIHFRYEDKVTSPDAPFAVGFTLQNLSAETTNELWQECVVDASVKTVYKIVSLDCLSVYWNTNLTSANFFGSQSSWKDLMSGGVSSKGSVPSDYEFILKPLSAECHVVMDQSSDIVLDTPKFLIEVLQQELLLAFSQNQFHNVMDLIESFELMAVNQLYQKYRPTIPVRVGPAAWWKYAYTAICEEKIRCWSWSRIKEHRRKYKMYKELWERKLRGLNEDEESTVLPRIQSLEDKLDIPSILIARRHAELEVPPSQLFNPHKKHKSNPWWLWLGIGSGSFTDYEGIMNKQKQEENVWSKLSVAALPAEEKEKLYKAIDYNESVRVKYPTEFIKLRITFNLDRCTFVLCDTKNSEIAQLDTEGFEAALEHRPAQNAFRFHAKINRFKMLGSSEEDQESKECLVSSKKSRHRQGTALVECTLETKPLERNADYAVSLKVEPVEMIYDSHTIDNIIAFFHMPENTMLQELEVAAANKLQELRIWTRAGLEYAITHHQVTYLDLDVKSPFVVIPEYGTLQRDGSVLAVDLGHLKVVSNLASRDTSVRKASDHELEEMFYDKFELTLEDVQVMIFDKSLKWKSMQDLSSSPHHILPSTALNLQLQKSITTDNPELPEFKVSSVLPSLHLKLSDKKFKMLMKFLDHLPFGVQQPSLLEEKRADILSKNEWKHSSSTLSLEEASDLQAIFNNVMIARLHSTEDDDVWYDAEENLLKESAGDQAVVSEARDVDKIKLAGKFTIEKLLITVDQADEQSTNDDPYLSLEMRDVGTVLAVHSWDIRAQVKLGFIQILDKHWKDIDGSDLCVLTSSVTDNWITINYVKADPSGPEFKTTFLSIEQLIEMRFSSLKLTAKQEAIASFQIFVLSLFQSTGLEPETVPRRLLETITEEDQLDSSVATKVTKRNKTEDKKSESESDAVNFKVVAEVEKFTVILSSMDRHVGKVDVKGLDVKIDVFPAETNIIAKLEDLGIEDLTKGTLYPQILDLADNTVFDCQITIFNKSSQGAFADQDPTALDFSVDVKLGKLRFVFLGYFVAHLQNFLEALVSPETVAYAQEVTQKAVLKQVQQKQGAKIGLHISVNAPQILIPCNSKSSEKLIADLGQLQIANSIISSSQHGLIDRMGVSLSSFQVSGTSEEEKCLSNHLIEPVELNVVVKRRLNLEKSDLPLIEVEGNLELLKINLGLDDFQMLMMVLNDNLLEGQQERQPVPKVETVETEQPEGQQASPAPDTGSLDRTDAKSIEEVPNIKCQYTITKVLVSSPKIVNGVSTPYLVLETKNMSAIVTMETWILNASAKLGGVKLLDHLNKDEDGSPVRLLSSSRDADLISVSYKRVDPRCPEFESTFCTIEQQITVTFTKLTIDCLQKALMDLQIHGLALISSLGETSTSAPAPTVQNNPETGQKGQRTVSLKVEATLSEVDVLLRQPRKNLADIKVRGLTAELLLWEGGLVLKSRQNDLSVVDLNAQTYYPKIISVENENVFDFEFKYFSDTNKPKTDEPSTADLTKPDGNLELNIGKINIVFLYKFINELLKFVEPLTSPQSTEYVKATAQRAATEQIESIQSQGTRIALQVAISAPLVIIPRHSHSVDMLLVDLGHLDLQNEFDLLLLPGEHDYKERVFDIMELSLQSVQLTRGVMDLSSSAVVKRHLIEPIKLDANIKRSLVPSCQDVPIVECSATLDFVKMNLGQQDYHVLTTLFQENLKESESYALMEEENQPSENSADEREEQSEPTTAANTSAEPGPAQEATDTAWDQMVFSFDLVGASLTLYSKEKPLDPFDSQSSVCDPATRLCLFEVDKSVVTVVLSSDRSVQIHCMLNGCVVEDVRKGTVSVFPRLIDKKEATCVSVTKSPNKEMCDIAFCQLPSGEMKVDISLQNATIFVNFPFILPLLEFFTSPSSDLYDQRQRRQFTIASQTSFDATRGRALSPATGNGDVPFHRSESEVITATEALSQVDAAPLASQGSPMKISVHGVVKESDIVLLSDASRRDSEALIVQAEVEFDYKLEDVKQRLSADFTNLQLQASQFPDVKKISYKVLSPCSLTFKYLTPASSEGGQDWNISLKDEMMFEFSPGLLTTLSNVVAALTGQQKVDESIQTAGHEVIAAPGDLWDTKPASAEYWYKKKATEDSKPKLVARRSTGDKLSLTTKEVQVAFVNEIEGAHVPMLLVRSSVAGKVSDWSAQLKVEGDVEVQVSYYNERLAAWEPLLEPVIVEDEKSMWRVQVKLFLAEGYVSSFSPKDVESCDGPPRDITDAFKPGDVTDSGMRSEAKKRTPIKRPRRLSSLRCSGRRGWSGKRSKGRQYPTDITSDDEDDLDYEGALAIFVQSTKRVFEDPSSDAKSFHGVDAVDAPPLHEVHAADQDRQSQATYLVINSHDDMQLTITPRAIQILSELSELWSGDRKQKLRTVPGPTFAIHNELGIHSAVTVSPNHQVLDTDQLTVRQRIPKQAAVRQYSLADVAKELGNSAQKWQQRDLKRMLSEPLFNHLREKLQKIRKKRASSEPVSLKAIRQRKLSQQNPVSFQIGEQTSSPVKTISLVSAARPDMKTAGSSQPPELSSSPSKESIPEDETVAIKANNNVEILSAHPPPEELEEKNDPRSSFETQVGHTIANIGALVGGIFAPHHVAGSNERDSEVAGSDSAVDDDNIISLTVDGFYNVSRISIARSGSYLYKLSPKDAVVLEANHKWYLVVQVEIKNGRKTVTIRSPLQVQNHLQVPVDIFGLRQGSTGSREEDPVKLFTVEPSGVHNVPFYATYSEELFVKPSGSDYNISSSALTWSKFIKKEPSCVLICPSSKDSQTSSAFYIKALCQADNLNKLPAGVDFPHHVIRLYPPLVVHNKLPFELVLSPQEKEGEDKIILPGDKAPLVSDCPGDACQIKLRDYKGVNWIGQLSVKREGGKSQELLMQSEEATAKELSLGVLSMHQSGTRELFIYSPYWLINKTGLHVEYRVSKTKQVYEQSAVEKHPLLFNFTEKSYRKARLRVLGHSWSSKFSLDAVGDSGKVTCKASEGIKFEFILQIEMSRTGLTKIVTLTPKYVIINNTEISVSFIENRVINALWFVVEPGESKPFWPRDKSGSIVLKRTMSNVISQPFNFNSSHTTVLRIPELQALTVNVHGEVEDSVTTIVVTPFSPGIGTIRIENLCDNIPIRFHQKDSGQVTLLDSKKMILYTWDDPRGVRKLFWKPYMGMDKPIEIPVDKDDFGEIRVELDENRPPVKDDRKELEDRDATCGMLCGSSVAVSERMDDLDAVDGPMYHRVKKTIHWVSVMDGLQRVLVFADDKNLSCLTRKCCDYEVVNMELFVSLDGVGLSLVNRKPDEVAYIKLRRSASVWQVERSPGRWKTLNLEWSTWLEDAWSNNAGEVTLEDKEVNFNLMRMSRPYEGALRRLFEPALWFNYTSSDHYHSLHCKMHHIQIDNQQIGTVFPVALYPSPLPKAVIQKSGFKPFIEVSLIYHQVPREGMHHIKYAMALVQEMNVKVDKELIISLTSLFSQQKELLEEETYFDEDMKRVAVPLRETEAVKAALETQKVFLEYFHLSPLKINLSFSLASSFDEDDEDQAFAHDLLDFFIDSIGATLTDINDVQLRMACFERVSVFLTQENLVAQIWRHYTMQGVRQIYVLVLGLDVIGNPYGLIHGIGEGVRDFFYEPYQGIVAGPSGFAEGVARGVKSLLGHVIGDTAGAFSRITSSLGQAVATLTFDSNFQMRRRMRMHRGPEGIGQGLLMGGKSLLMGLFFGVTGIVVKPVEGAGAEGVEGFFKGIGKGLLGLLVHPTGGVVDMVSFTLDGVRRSAEQNGEDIPIRNRLPRFTAPNTPLKPFSEHDAEGNGILKSLDQFDDVYVDHMGITEGDSSSVVLWTDRRILNLYQRKFWQGWRVTWSCLYENIADFPFLTTKALVIKEESTKDRGPISDLSVSTHEVVSSNKAQLQTLKSKIDNAIRHYRSTRNEAES